MASFQTRLRLALGATLAAGSIVVGGVLNIDTAQAAPGDISGQAFRDTDHDGVQGDGERHEGGILVTVYNDGGPIGSTTTDLDDGTYAFTGLPTGPYRVEFEIPAEAVGLEPTRFPDAATPGAIRSGTAVQFTDGDATDIDFGVADPLSYCGSANPDVATACFTNGVASDGGKSIIQHKYLDAGRVTGINPGVQPDITATPADHSTGAVWGIAYQRTTGAIFTGAMMKRHVGLGPGGIDAIYTAQSGVDNSDALWFTAIDTDPGDIVQTNVERGLAGPSEPTLDIDAYGQVGTVGWGGAALSVDDRFLFAVNAGSKTLAAIDIASVTDPTTGTFTETAIPDPGCTNGQWRPWALGQVAGKIYVGGVCDATGPGASTLDLVAHVYEGVPAADPSTGGVAFAPVPVLTIELDYDGVADTADKGCAAIWVGDAGCQWYPWINTWDDAQYEIYDGGDVYLRPSPILSDLEFDDEGYMILGFTDRNAHQLGNRNRKPVPNDASNISAVVGGDTLIAAPNNTFDAWILESAGVVGDRTTAGPGNDASGPGGGEFFFKDQLATLQSETTQGGLGVLPSSGEVIGTVMDPLRQNSAGSARYRVGDGTKVQVIEYYLQGDVLGPTFAKAGGLGDIEVFCNRAPIQVGNYVWFDTDNDGVQDPSEQPVPGVSVELLDQNGDPVLDGAGQPVVAITDANGQYYIDEGSDGTSVLEPDTPYQLRFDITSEPADTSALPGAPPADTLTFTANDTDDDVRDSDAVVGDTGNIGTIAFTTGGPGANDHTLDAGLVPAQRLGNLVWFDENNNGIVDDDGNETPLSGLAVELWRDDGDGAFDPAIDELVDSTTTGAAGGATAGEYLFEFLASGDYFVAIPQSQLDSGGPAAGLESSTGNDDANDLSPDPNVGGPGDAGLDNDDNGDPSDYGIVSQMVTLSVGDEQTDETGGFAASGADDEGDGNAIIVDGDSNLTVDFGLYQPLRVGNLVWLDADNNGVADPGEAPLPGVLVQLLDDSSAVIAETTTDPSGRYLFDGLDAGIYRIGIPSGQAAFDALNSSTSGDGNPAADADGDVDDVDDGEPDLVNGWASITSPFTLDYGTEPEDEAGDFGAGNAEDAADSAAPGRDSSSNLTVDFGFYALALGDTVFLDNANTGNIVPSDADLGIPGITVDLYLDRSAQGPGDGVFDPDTDSLVGTDTTEADGKYYFDGLVEGDYFVHIPPTDFADGAVLRGYFSSTGNGEAPDVDDDTTEDDDNGDPVDGDEPAGGVVSKLITLEPGGEPEGDAMDDPNGTGIADTSENTTVDFGVYTLEVGNQVFLDVDNNELFDGADAGIAEVTVNLLDQDGNVVQTTTTDANGNYLFVGLPEGTYSVELPASNFDAGGPLAGLYSSDGPDASDDPADVDADTSDVDDNGRPADPALKYLGGAVVSEPFDLAAGTEPDDETDESPRGLFDTASNLTVDLGLTPLPKLELGNQLWFDADNSGTFDDGEDPLPDGVVVNLWSDDDGDGVPDTLLETTTTADGTGQYLFDGLTPGTYIVQIDPSNFAPGGPLEGFGPSTGPASSTDPNDDTENNNDGFTGPNGGIITGPIELGIGAEPTDDADEPITTDDANSNLTVDIGLVPLPELELGNQIFIDVANDGDGTGDDPAPEGVVVNLVDMGGAVVDTTTTDADGQYLFTGLAPGTYMVELPASNFAPGGPLAGYVASSGPAISANPNDDVDNNSDGIDQGDGSVKSGPVSLTVGGEPADEIDPADSAPNDSSNLSVDFGVWQPASVGDFVWVDADRDGVQDPGEAGVTGVVMELLDEDGTVIATTTTDSNGAYLFGDLPPGTYSIRLVRASLPANSLLTTPGQGDAETGSDIGPITFTTVPFTLDSGENSTEWDAGIVLGSVLPATGGESGGVLQMAAQLLLLGIALLSMGRRRRPMLLD